MEKNELNPDAPTPPPMLAGAFVRPSGELLRALSETPWAIMESAVPMALHQVRTIAAGHRLTAEEARELSAGARGPVSHDIKGGVAVVRMSGLLGIPTLFSLFFGDPLERFAQAFRSAMADPAIHGIVISIDSPGGSVYGIDELASEVYAARSRKKIIALADPLAASAAYYIGSQAHEFIVTPSGEAGSIGVIATHEDWSGFYAKAGVVPTIISAGKYKAEFADTQPLSDEARAHMQQRVDTYYGMFVNAVARGRNVSADSVRGGYGEGRVLGAQEAVKLGLADRVGGIGIAVSRAARPAATALTLNLDIHALDSGTFAQLMSDEKWCNDLREVVYASIKTMRGAAVAEEEGEEVEEKPSPDPVTDPDPDPDHDPPTEALDRPAYYAALVEKGVLTAQEAERLKQTAEEAESAFWDAVAAVSTGKETAEASAGRGFSEKQLYALQCVQEFGRRRNDTITPTNTAQTSPEAKSAPVDANKTSPRASRRRRQVQLWEASAPKEVVR